MFRSFLLTCPVIFVVYEELEGETRGEILRSSVTRNMIQEKMRVSLSQYKNEESNFCAVCDI